MRNGFSTQQELFLVLIFQCSLAGVIFRHPVSFMFSGLAQFFEPKFPTALCWRGKENVLLFIWHLGSVLWAGRRVLVCQSGSGKLALVPALSLAWLGRGDWLFAARLISHLAC